MTDRPTWYRVSYNSAAGTVRRDFPSEEEAADWARRVGHTRDAAIEPLPKGTALETVPYGDVVRQAELCGGVA